LDLDRVVVGVEEVVGTIVEEVVADVLEFEPDSE
jgi:hypothetical protein